MYICDTGLANRFARLDMGHLFENSVFQNLRVTGELNYYQKKSGVEIDFILDKKTAYEVKITPRESDIRKLRELAGELGLEDYMIISRNYITLKGIKYGFMV